MDDFVISTKTKKELEKRMIQFLKITEKHNLCFKWSKCNFNVEEISILGVVIGQEVQMENDKVKIVKEWNILNQNKRSWKLFGVCKLLLKVS